MEFDLPPALKYLDNLQKKRNLISLRKFEEDEIYKMSLDKSYESPVHFLIKPEYLEIRNCIPELQSIIQYQILERHKKDFDNLMVNKFENSESYNVSDNVYFGTLISLEFNANIQPVNGSQYLIILNESLWDGFKGISDIVAEPLSLSKSSSDFLDIDWKAVEKNVYRFGELLNRILRCKPLYGIELKPSIEKNETWNFLWDEFHESMESFAFGHEYGHFLKGHTFNNNIPAIKKWAQEYEADRVGLDLETVY